MCLPIPFVDQTEPSRYQDSLRRFTIAVASLSETEQNLFNLRCYQKRPVTEIADLYGLNPTTVDMLLRRIDHKLEQYYARQLAG